MDEKNPMDNLNDQVRRFLEVYKVLPPDARVSFEIEIAKKKGSMDERTKRLYDALIQAARDGMNFEQAISKMKEIK